MKIPSSEITPEHIYLNRRGFIKAAGFAGASVLLAACGVKPGGGSNAGSTQAPAPTVKEGAFGMTDELGDALTPYDAVTGFNNFYEFSTDKEKVAGLVGNFMSSPWQVEVGGLVSKPTTFGMEELLKFDQEDRIYRLRCVEGWSMVIPWQGFPLSKILEAVEPTSAAKYVRFVSLDDPQQFPGQKSPWYSWPYSEGMRMDEAYNELTLIATGVYGQALPAQNGAPLRLVTPWKYGFKSIKSIVKIELVDYEPVSLWMDAAPNEYGFYANVNPDVPHPRWSQSTERRIGEGGRRNTLPFNGYAEQVAHLYAGMDLSKYY